MSAEPENELSLQSTVVAAENQVSSEIGGEKVILGVESGLYFGLKGVASQIWEMLAEPVQVEEIRDALMRDYDVTAERCERDLFDLLAKLVKHDLVVVRRDTRR